MSKFQNIFVFNKQWFYSILRCFYFEKMFLACIRPPRVWWHWHRNDASWRRWRRLHLGQGWQDQTKDRSRKLLKTKSKQKLSVEMPFFHFWNLSKMQVSKCSIELHERDLTVEMKGSAEARARAKRYLKCVMAQRKGPVYVEEEPGNNNILNIAQIWNRFSNSISSIIKAILILKFCIQCKIYMFYIVF